MTSVRTKKKAINKVKSLQEMKAEVEKHLKHSDVKTALIAYLDSEIDGFKKTTEHCFIMRTTDRNKAAKMMY